MEAFIKRRAAIMISSIIHGATIWCIHRGRKKSVTALLGLRNDLIMRRYALLMSINLAFGFAIHLCSLQALHSNISVNEMIVFGGRAGSVARHTSARTLTEYNDLWRLYLVTVQWSVDYVASSSASPPPRSEATISVYSDQLLLFGGIAYAKADAPQRTMTSGAMTSWIACETDHSERP